jgi:tetratricopeptide (TPR) repeat protein
MREGAVTVSQWLQGNQSVQISHVEQSTIQITYGDQVVGRIVPLERAVVAPGRSVRSPARLMRARSGVIPYVARGGVLGEIEQWVTGPEAFAGCVIGGGGGIGKTRLGVALCGRAETERWLCGLLAPTADQGALEALVQAPTARLIVVDYAETRVEQLEQLLPLLAASATAQHPVRVVLLVRARPRANSDWAGLLRDRSDALDACLDDMATWALEEHPLTLVERHALFGSAFVALAARTDEPRAAPDAPDRLAEDVFATPLMVVIAAYLALHDERDLPASRAELLERLLVHEQRYWKPSAETVGIGHDVTLQRRIVALAALTAAGSEPRARELLSLITDFADAPAERRGTLARWAHELYPTGESFWNPLEPDLLGEHLIAVTYAHEPAILAGVLQTDDPAALLRPLDVYARAAIEHPDLRATVAAILTDSLQALCDLAGAQAASTTDLATLLGDSTLAAALERATSVIEVDAAVLPAILNSLPQGSTLSLGALKLTLTGQLLANLRHAADRDPQRHTPTLAIALNNQSKMLSDLGRREDALTAIEEAVTIRRRLPDARPDAFLPDLALSLNNQSAMLSGLGRREDALVSIEEAITIYRQLADAHPDAFLPDLATSLNNQSNSLSELGRREDALTVIEEAITIYRQLADAHPVAFLPDLATSLNNQSNSLSELGRREDALTVIEEAVTIRRQLADAYPDAFLPDLATSLYNQSNSLSKLGRRQDALAVIEDAVTIRRQLADAYPDAFLPDLTLSLNNQSSVLSALGRHEDALTTIDEALRLVLPILERAYYVLPDSGLRLVENYRRLCQETEREPDVDTIQRMHRVLLSAGVITADYGQ